MKTLLVIAFATFGPGALTDIPPSAYTQIFSFDLVTEEACTEAAKRYPRPDAPGQIGNLPGYRGIEGAWCEDPAAPWPERPLLAR